jgi:hypothetical protein
MKAKVLDGMIYDKEFCNQNRQAVIELRDEALKQADFEYAVILSRTVAILADYMDRLES